LPSSLYLRILRRECTSSDQSRGMVSKGFVTVERLVFDRGGPCGTVPGLFEGRPLEGRKEHYITNVEHISEEQPQQATSDVETKPPMCRGVH
jgi:hypothetical protein